MEEDHAPAFNRSTVNLRHLRHRVRYGSDNSSRTYHSKLEYFKAIARSGPVGDPQIVGLLLVQFLNANQLTDGIGFFEGLLRGPASGRSPREKALYLAALGALRASYADQVFLLRRANWVNETIDQLEQARRLSANESFLVRWIIGVVYAQLPDSFHKTSAPKDDLHWCINHIG
ncbi:MAG: hypothetical protein ACREVK_04945 [Gammaproteobacteria bacterium]